MADDKKNILDAGKIDEPLKPGKVEPIKVVPRCRISPPRPRQRPQKIRVLLFRLKRVRRSRVRARNRPQSPAWEILPPLGKW